MSNVSDLIQRAEAALKKIDPPWTAYGREVLDPEGYAVASDVLGGDLLFIVAAPTLIRELVDALLLLGMQNERV